MGHVVRVLQFDKLSRRFFLPNVAGCIEHSATFNQALLDARNRKRNIAINWLDLANAFSSASHNLILFALSWYHVPTWCSNLIYLYYSSLFARIVTFKWALRHNVGMEENIHHERVHNVEHRNLGPENTPVRNGMELRRKKLKMGLG